MPRCFVPACLLFTLHFALLTAGAEVSVRKAVFTDHQLFWPTLEGKGKPASPAKAKGKAVKPDPKALPARIAVLPVSIKDYSETVVCDSCHRLSANGMEFFLENWLKDRMAARFPAQGVELIAPQAHLLEKRVDLMAYLDSLQLPWDKWLADSGQEVIYRPRDRYTSAAARQRLDKLGGMLGVTHLLLPARVRVHVAPMASNTHTGGLEWGFDLALWNVAAGRPEWAFQFRESDMAMDLDQALDARLDKALGGAWDGMPAELTALWASEPH